MVFVKTLLGSHATAASVNESSANREVPLVLVERGLLGFVMFLERTMTKLKEFWSLLSFIYNIKISKFEYIG